MQLDWAEKHILLKVKFLRYHFYQQIYSLQCNKILLLKTHAHFKWGIPSLLTPEKWEQAAFITDSLELPNSWSFLYLLIMLPIYRIFIFAVLEEKNVETFYLYVQFTDSSRYQPQNFQCYWLWWFLLSTGFAVLLNHPRCFQ